jgi:hypothetical protein
MQFHWVRFGLLVAAAVGLAAGAAGPTDQDSRVVVALWIGAGIAAIGALVEVAVWWFPRPKPPTPTPQTIHAPTIDSQPESFSPTVVQGDRPGWKAMCADGGSQQQPHGAVLYIASDRETAGEYTFEWFGYVDESPNEMLLASGTFRVNSHLQVFCGKG